MSNEPLVSVQDLFITYREASGPALRGVSVELGAGELVVVMGGERGGEVHAVPVLERDHTELPAGDAGGKGGDSRARHAGA